ncbi:hypothetical protein ANCDUO_22182, partial [Ancylostoma duodenale]
MAEFLKNGPFQVSVMDDEQLLDYEEEQEETHEPKAAENGSGDAKKIK